MVRRKAEIEAELAAKNERLQEVLGELKEAKNQLQPTKPSKLAQTKVPGLPNFTPKTSKGMIPQFNEGDFVIKDPLNPKLPTVSIEQHEEAVENYKGANRALDLYGMGFDTTGKMFSVVGKRAKAVGAGIDAVTETEKTRGAFLNYLGQLQSNQQSAIALNAATYKTGIDSQSAAFTITGLDYSLQEAEVKSQLALGKLAETSNKLRLLKESLGNDFIEAKAEETV